MRNYKLIVLTAVLGAAILSGCTTTSQSSGDRTAGRALDDKNITAKVADGLSNEPVYKFTDVDVRTFEGVVQLSGFVKNEDQKQRAGQIAQNTPGVARVVNSIVVQPENAEGLTPTGRSNQGTMAPAEQSDTNKEEKTTE